MRRVSTRTTLLAWTYERLFPDMNNHQCLEITRPRCLFLQDDFLDAIYLLKVNSFSFMN